MAFLPGRVLGVQKSTKAEDSVEFVFIGDTFFVLRGPPLPEFGLRAVEHVVDKPVANLSTNLLILLLGDQFLSVKVLEEFRFSLVAVDFQARLFDTATDPQDDHETENHVGDKREGPEEEFGDFCRVKVFRGQEGGEPDSGEEKREGRRAGRKEGSQMPEKARNGICPRRNPPGESA
jgi:hypothetical protein